MMVVANYFVVLTWGEKQTKFIRTMGQTMDGVTGQVSTIVAFNSDNGHTRDCRIWWWGPKQGVYSTLVLHQSANNSPTDRQREQCAHSPASKSARLVQTIFLCSPLPQTTIAWQAVVVALTTVVPSHHSNWRSICRCEPINQCLYACVREKGITHELGT